MNIDLDKLIDCLIDLQYEDKKAIESKKNNFSNNDHLSVKIGLERKHLLEQIAYEKKLDISKVTRLILDSYFSNYYGCGLAIEADPLTAWQYPKEAMKVSK